MAIVKIVTCDSDCKVGQTMGEPETVDDMLGLVYRALIGCGYTATSVVHGMHDYESDLIAGENECSGNIYVGEF